MGPGPPWHWWETAPLTSPARLEIILAFAATKFLFCCFYLYCLFPDARSCFFFCAEASGWPWMVMLTLLSFVTLGGFVLFVFCQQCTFEWYCWRLYVLLLTLLFFRLPNHFSCGFLPICFLLLVSTWLEVDSLIDRSIGRLIDWLIDLIDWLIDRLLGDWLFGFVRSFFLILRLVSMSAVTLASFCWPFVVL